MKRSQDESTQTKVDKVDKWNVEPTENVHTFYNKGCLQRTGVGREDQQKGVLQDNGEPEGDHEERFHSPLHDPVEEKDLNEVAYEEHERSHKDDGEERVNAHHLKKEKAEIT
jgi:hypothetical protein